MDDVSERFLGALSALQGVADEVTSNQAAATLDEAAATLDEAALQVFWRDWPRLGSWAGALWRQIDLDLAGPSSAVGDPELDEVGAKAADGRRDRHGWRVAEGTMVKLAEIMTADVFTVAPDAPVAAVAAAMVKRRLGSAVVMQGQMVGIFTERDVLRRRRRVATWPVHPCPGG